MSRYTKKSALIAVVLCFSLLMAQWSRQWDIPYISFFGVIFLSGVFSLMNYFVHKDTQIDENKKIRRLMIGSMIRLFLVVIFLGINLFNMSKISFEFVVVYGISFLLFLFFDIFEMRTNLRPDLEKSNGKSNA